MFSSRSHSTCDCFIPLAIKNRSLGVKQTCTCATVSGTARSPMCRAPPHALFFGRGLLKFHMVVSARLPMQVTQSSSHGSKLRGERVFQDLEHVSINVRASVLHSHSRRRVNFLGLTRFPSVSPHFKPELSHKRPRSCHDLHLEQLGVFGVTARPVCSHRGVRVQQYCGHTRCQTAGLLPSNCRDGPHPILHESLPPAC